LQGSSNVNDIMFAAETAARYSKAPLHSNVDVHVCSVFDVSKPKRSRPGLVLLNMVNTKS